MKRILERAGLQLLAWAGWTVRTVAAGEIEKAVIESGQRYVIAPNVPVHVFDRTGAVTPAGLAPKKRVS